MSKKRPMRTGRPSKSCKVHKAAESAVDASLSPDATLLRVALTFFIIYAVLQVLLWWLASLGALEQVGLLTASVAGACSTMTGVPAVVEGNEIVLSTRILRIDFDCTGLSIAILYVALVLAYPLSARRKLIGLVLGLPVLFAANLGRLVAVAQLSERLDDAAFYFAHDYLFKVAMVAVVIGLWAVHLTSARRHAA